MHNHLTVFFFPSSEVKEVAAPAEAAEKKGESAAEKKDEKVDSRKQISRKLRRKLSQTRFVALLPSLDSRFLSTFMLSIPV